MYWITPHSLFSLSWDEWASIVAILSAIVLLMRWLVKKVNVELFDPITKQLTIFNQNMKHLNARQEEAEQRLEHGDKQFIRHDEELKDHERRITYLEEKQ